MDIKQAVLCELASLLGGLNSKIAELNETIESHDRTIYHLTLQRDEACNTIEEALDFIDGEIAVDAKVIGRILEGG